MERGKLFLPVHRLRQRGNNSGKRFEQRFRHLREASGAAQADAALPGNPRFPAKTRYLLQGNPVLFPLVKAALSNGIERQGPPLLLPAVHLPFHKKAQQMRGQTIHIQRENHDGGFTVCQRLPSLRPGSDSIHPDAGACKPFLQKLQNLLRITPRRFRTAVNQRGHSSPSLSNASSSGERPSRTVTLCAFRFSPLASASRRKTACSSGETSSPYPKTRSRNLSG